MDPGEHSDIRPGISAVLAIEFGQASAEGVILDLGAVLDGLVADQFEIIVIEYGAGGPTPGLLDDLAVRWPTLPLRVLPVAQPDQPTALAAGFDASRYDLLFATTPDGQFNVYELNRLLEAIERGADVAVGYRRSRADGLAPRLTGWAWNALLTVVFGKTARDVECAFKLFRRIAWVQLEPRPRKDRFNIDVLVGARRLGFRIAEVPVSHRRAYQSAGAAAGVPLSAGRPAA
jgi:hypothetical protein